MAHSQYDGNFESGRSIGKRAMGIAACGACKHLRKKCSVDCIFAPYFTTDEGAAKFATVHKVFGASNVSKLLSSIPNNCRNQAMETLSYEAEARSSDPINGCVSTIKNLQQQVATLEAENTVLRSQLVNNKFSAYATAIIQQHQQQPNFRAEVPVYSNNSPASINNHMYMSDFNTSTTNNSPASINNHMYMSNFNTSTTNLMDMSNFNSGYYLPNEPPQHF